MTEQKLRDEFEKLLTNGESLEFDSLAGCYVDPNINNVWIWFKTGHELSQETIKAKDAEIEKFKNLFNKAKTYIDECPCDPDIYPDQIKAWNEYQEELKKLNKNLDGKY